MNKTTALLKLIYKEVNNIDTEKTFTACITITVRTKNTNHLILDIIEVNEFYLTVLNDDHETIILSIDCIDTVDFKKHNVKVDYSFNILSFKLSIDRLLHESLFSYVNFNN